MRKVSLLLMLALLLTECAADITGEVSMSNELIQATDVTYTFNLRMLKKIPETGKIVIRFPDDFEQEFRVTGCVAKTGFKFEGEIDFIYVESVRLLTIEGKEGGF